MLILSQMILMLDILELFLNFHFLTFVRIDEYANQEQRQVSVPYQLPTGTAICAVQAFMHYSRERKFALFSTQFETLDVVSSVFLLGYSEFGVVFYFGVWFI